MAEMQAEATSSLYPEGRGTIEDLDRIVRRNLNGESVAALPREQKIEYVILQVARTEEKLAQAVLAGYDAEGIRLATMDLLFDLLALFAVNQPDRALADTIHEVVTRVSEREKAMLESRALAAKVREMLAGLNLAPRED